MILIADKIHCTNIAQLHIDGIKTGFLSRLGRNFLIKLYCAMADSTFGLLLASVDEKNQVDGFVSASKSTRNFYLDFMMSRYGIKCSLDLCRLLFSKQKPDSPYQQGSKHNLLKKCTETLFYPFIKRKDYFLPEAELLSIVVKKEKWGSDISGELLKDLKNKLYLQGIKQFKVVVDEANIRACRFYEKAGGELRRRVEVHEGETSNVYVFNTI